MHQALLMGFLLLAGPAADAPPHLLIAGGGTSRAEAERVRDSLSRIDAPLREVLTLSQGYPRIVESRTMAGLNPGFWVVALGVCRSPQEPLAAVKAIYPGAYSRALQGGVPEACPRLSSRRVAALAPRLQAPGKQVTAFELLVDEEDDRGRELKSSVLHFVLMDTRTGEVLHATSVEGARSGASGDGPAGREYEDCTAAVTVTPAGMAVQRTCRDERSGCNAGERAIPRAWTEAVTVSTRGDELLTSAVRTRVTDRSPCVAGASEGD